MGLELGLGLPSALSSSCSRSYVNIPDPNIKLSVGSSDCFRFGFPYLSQCFCYTLTLVLRLRA